MTVPDSPIQRETYNALTVTCSNSLLISLQVLIRRHSIDKGQYRTSALGHMDLPVETLLCPVGRPLFRSSGHSAVSAKAEVSVYAQKIYPACIKCKLRYLATQSKTSRKNTWLQRALNPDNLTDYASVDMSAQLWLPQKCQLGRVSLSRSKLLPGHLAFLWIVSVSSIVFVGLDTPIRNVRFLRTGMETGEDSPDAVMPMYP